LNSDQLSLCTDLHQLYGTGVLTSLVPRDEKGMREGMRIQKKIRRWGTRARQGGQEGREGPIFWLLNHLQFWDQLGQDG